MSAKLKTVKSAKAAKVSGELNYPGLNCYDIRVNAYYVGIHAITKATYEEMIKRFFGKLVAEKSYTAESLDVKNYVCKDYIKFDTGRSTTMNGDLTVLPTVGIRDEGKYSIHFFRGLQNLFTVGSYKFSKAKHADGTITMAISVLDTTGATVYHGDLTHMFP